MNTNVRKKIRGVKLAALLLTAALVLAAIIPQIGTTLAAAGDINVVLECESGIGEALTVEVGQAKVRTVSGLIDAESGDASVIKVEATPSLFFNNLRAIGVKAGVASIGYGNNLGSVTVLTYQVTDSDNVSAYRISNGGEVYFTSPGHTKASPVNVTAGRFDRINWGVMNENVATVAADGAITATGYGVTVIIGSFADKWGVDRNLHLLVGVGVKIGLSDLGDLIDLLTEAERILAEDPSPYTEKELAALQEAVDNIKDMLNTGTPTEQEILDAIKELETIIENLGKGLPDGVVEGEDGNYYKGVDENDGVFVVVDKDGEPATEPPGYVWAGPDGVPGTEDDRPAVEVDGNFYVEEPEGGNIWREIDENGNLKDKPLVWGGPDGVLGTEDDRPVVEVDGGLYVEEPQGGNVWREIDENGNLKDKPVIWGGPDGILGTDDDRLAVEVDGGLYVEEPEGGNIWREVDENGNLKDKPVIWGGPDGILGTEDDRIAVEVDGGLYVEEPEGGNIWREIDENGNLKDKPIIWGGPDGVLGTEDDRIAVEVDGGLYVEEPEGGNVWREIDENGNLKDKPLVWGGPDGVLGTEDDRPVVEVDGGLYVEEPQGGNVWREIDENGNLKDNPVIWGGPDGILGTGDDRIAVEVDGGLYVEEPEGGNIWREIDENGNLKDKPVIWGGPDGILGTDDDRIAVEVDGGLYVEDPQGSNIWREIGANGKLKDAPLIWAGPDGKLGGGNDEIVEFFDGEYWAHKGQNVWRQVDLANPTAPLGALTGGGPTKNPAQHGVVPIFDNTKKDGKYYIGPLGFDDCLFYYGDGPDGNGLLDSTTEEPIGDDIVYLMDKDGNMVTAPTGVVIGLVISPANAKVPRGGTQQFTAMALTGDGFLIEATNVVWGISTPGHKSSIHTLNGLLTVGANEYLKTLEITASLFSAGSVKGTTIVNIAGWNV